ncbi:MAG TPA: lipase family protein, partial [Chloroflexota bacterium]|nr:lipase family protein [Chloroflexota bacterium]
LTLHVLRAARESGQQRAVLQSTEAGESMYRTIGFQPRCRIAVYRHSRPSGALRGALGRIRRLGERAAAVFGLTAATVALGLGLSACALLETPAPAPTLAPPTEVPTPTPVPPTPTPDPRGTLLERRPPTTFQPVQINQIMPRLYPAGTSNPARYPVEVHFIRYVSTEPNGERLDILAQVYLPRVDAATPMTVLVYGAGTTGLGDQCAPSREQPTARNWGDYQAHLLSYASQGYITIMPDYAGFNDGNRLQRYFVAQSEARVLLDATRALYKFFQEAAPGSLGGASPSKSVFYAGYSQGGHAAFAVRDEYLSYAPDVPVTGVIGHGGSMDLTALLRDSPSFAPMLLYSLSDFHGTTGPLGVDVGKLLNARWLPTLAVDMNTKCIDQMAGYYTNNHATVYSPQFNAALMGNRLEPEFPSVKEALERNSTGQAASNVPALVVQGATDPIVTQRTADAFVARLCAAGQHVNYILYPGVHHYQTRQVGFRDTMSWMDAVARGAPPPSTCRR